MIMTIDLVPSHLQKYVGLRFFMEDQQQRAEHMRFTFANESLSASESPQGLLSRNGLLLCDETRELLYQGDFGKLSRPYRRGTFPLLEQYIEALITPEMTDGEKVITISQSMFYDIVKKHPKVPAFLYGESDQETLLKGGGHCSCKARLLSAMCQIIGISARPAMQWTWRDHAPGKDPAKLLGGHTVAEVFIDGHWGFFDPQHHLYCCDDRGRFYSIDEIRRNPEVFTHMPQSIVDAMQAVGYPPADQGDQTVFEYYWYKNFNFNCPIQISRHDVMEPYAGGWFWATPVVREKMEADMASNMEILKRLADHNELTDEIYQLGLDDFRARFGITDGALQSRAKVDYTGRPRVTSSV